MMKNFLFIVFQFFSVSFSATPSNMENFIARGLSQGHRESVLSFLNRLAEKSNAEAIHYLGVLALDGIISKPSGCRFREANFFFFKGIHLGYAPSMKAIADSYIAGQGTPKNEDLALYWYLRSAMLGYGPAQFNAGVLLRKSDPKRAIFYLRKASLNPMVSFLHKDARKLIDQIRKLRKK